MWPLVEGYIVKAMKYGAGRYLPGDVLQRLVSGHARLWVAANTETGEIDAAVVTQILEYPRLKELHIWLVGGRNMRGWVKQAQAMIEDYGRAYGCAISAGGARRGWMRVGGYTPSGYTYEKRL